jgi:hypothetical protein
MKKMLLSLLGCVLSLQCFASNIQELNEKHYVSPGAIYVAPDAIYVNMNGNFMQVGGIAIDDNGIYVTGLSTRMITYCMSCGRTWDSQLHYSNCPHHPKCN